MKKSGKQKFQDFDLGTLGIQIKSDWTCDGRKKMVEHKKHQYSKNNSNSLYKKGKSYNISWNTNI